MWDTSDRFSPQVPRASAAVALSVEGVRAHAVFSVSLPSSLCAACTAALSVRLISDQNNLHVSESTFSGHLVENVGNGGGNFS